MSHPDARMSTAIVGAGGYIGQHFARLLADHPWFGPPKLVGGPRSSGRTLSELWLLAESDPPELPDPRLHESTPAGLGREGVQVVFSALPSGTSAPNSVITEHAVQTLHLHPVPSGWLIQTPHPLTAAQ
ncbi:MAG: hypothetical protein L3J96_00605, partial [Thermoplasmata archaeon]|nr:hypothetical protein [Thermoplasmata archaeon]